MASIEDVRKKCLRCGYSWIARVDRPKACPQCGHAHWDVPKFGKINQEREK